MWAWHRHSSASTERKREDRDMRKRDRRAQWLTWNGERMDGNNTKAPECLLEPSIQKLLRLDFSYAVEASQAKHKLISQMNFIHLSFADSKENVTRWWKSPSLIALSLFKNATSPPFLFFPKNAMVPNSYRFLQNCREWHRASSCLSIIKRKRQTDYTFTRVHKAFKAS